MQETYEFLKKNVFFLATVDEDGQPRNRPFGALCVFEGKLYIVTSNQKNVFKQMLNNPKVEISSAIGPEWIRLEASVVSDPRREARVAMLEANQETLSRLFNADDGVMEVLYFEKAKATFFSFTAPPRSVEF